MSSDVRQPHHARFRDVYWLHAARKLEASGYIRRATAPSDKRASIVELTDRGRALADQLKQLWCRLAEQTATGLPADTLAELPRLLATLAANVDSRRSRRQQSGQPEVE